MGVKLIVAGLGGQGVILTSRLVAWSAAELGHAVTAAETHGMSRRGGAVACHISIDAGDAPLIEEGTADMLLALDPAEALRNLAYLRPLGTCFVNTVAPLPAQVAPHLERLGIEVRAVDASGLAQAAGTTAAANVALLGFATAHPRWTLPTATVEAALALILPHAVDANRRAFTAGHRAGLAAAAADAPKGESAPPAASDSAPDPSPAPTTNTMTATATKRSHKRKGHRDHAAL